MTKPDFQQIFQLLSLSESTGSGEERHAIRHPGSGLMGGKLGTIFA
jgi:hypothetical protein